MTKPARAPWTLCTDPALDRPFDRVIRDADGWSIAYIPSVGPRADASAYADVEGEECLHSAVREARAAIRAARGEE